MSDQTDITTLQRKAGTGRVQSDGVGMTPAKAFRLAISKAAQVELGLPIQVLSIKETQFGQAELLEEFDPESLLLMLEGPQGGLGVAVLDMQVVAALIEVQTLGQVIASEAVKRAPTRTDSAMCEALLDQILKRFEAYLADSSAADWATGFRFEKQISNVRVLGLTLADVPYRMFQIDLNLADMAKQGVLQVIFPADGVRQAQDVSDPGADWTQTLEESVGDSQAAVSAVLHRLQMSLAEVQALKIDDLINVPKSAVSEIVIEGADGVVVGSARLGKQNGNRALRMTDGTAEPQPQSLGEQPSELPALGGVAAVDLGGGVPAIEPQMPELEMNTQAVDPISDLPDLPSLPDLPMMPMGDAPMDDLGDMPMAAMPMDVEIA